MLKDAIGAIETTKRLQDDAPLPYLYLECGRVPAQLLVAHSKSLQARGCVEVKKEERRRSMP